MTDQEARPRPRPCRGLGRVRAAARLSRQRRPRVQGQRGRPCRPGLCRPGRRDDRRPRLHGDAGLRQHPLAIPSRSRPTRASPRSRQRQARPELALRVHAGLPASSRGCRRPSRGRDVGAAEERRHHHLPIFDGRDGWVDDLPRPASAPCVCPMFRSGHWYTKNGHSWSTTGTRRPARRRFAAAIEAIDAAPKHPERPHLRHGRPGADRHLHARAAPRRRCRRRKRGTSRCRSTPPGSRRVPRDHAPPRQDADRMARHIGVLGPDLIIGHGIFLNDHP